MVTTMSKPPTRLAPAGARDHRRWRIGAIAVAVAAVILCWIARVPVDRSHLLDAQALMAASSAADIAAEERILKHFGSLCPGVSIGDWRSLPETHRVVLVSLCCDWNVLGMGIGSYLSRSRLDPSLPRLEEAAEAYRALGQATIADALGCAAAAAGDGGAPSADLQRAVETAIRDGRPKTRAARAAYVTEHAEALSH